MRLRARPWTERIRRRSGAAWRTHLGAHLLTITLLTLVWLALWGRWTVPLIVFGLVLSIIVLVLFPLPPIRFRIGFHPWSMVRLISRFAWDVTLASLQVAYLAFRPSPPATDVVVVQLVTGSDLIQHLTALAVSLIPGSLIIDADPDARTLMIHVLYPSARPPEIFAADVLAQEARFRAALGDRTTARSQRDTAGGGATTRRGEGVT